MDDKGQDRGGLMGLRLEEIDSHKVAGSLDFMRGCRVIITLSKSQLSCNICAQ